MKGMKDRRRKGCERVGHSQYKGSTEMFYKAKHTTKGFGLASSSLTHTFSLWSTAHQLLAPSSPPVCEQEVSGSPQMASPLHVLLLPPS